VADSEIAMLARVIPLTLVALSSLAGCRTDTVMELRAVGTLKIEVTLGPDVPAVQIEVLGADGVESDMRIEPAPLDRPDGAHQTAWQILALDPGDYLIVATPLDADDQPTTTCQAAQASVEVTVLETSPVLLEPRCADEMMAVL